MNAERKSLSPATMIWLFRLTLSFSPSSSYVSPSFSEAVPPAGS